jgi:phosphatidate phosphatase APP1
MLADISPSARTAIIDHIHAETKSIGIRGVRIYSDIDDTLYCTLHDRRYPRGTTYPGVVQLLAEIAAGPAAVTAPDAPGEVIFVTARPTAVGGVVERLTKQTLRARGVPRACVLTGDTRHMIGARIVTKKLELIERHACDVYPEDDVVFLGDSGQQDAAVAAGLAARLPGRIRATLIHDVVLLPNLQRASQLEANVRFFQTYAAAAAEAFQLGLIGAAALQRVCAAAVSEHNAVLFTSEAQRTQADAVLARDLALVEKVTRDATPRAAN